MIYDKPNYFAGPMTNAMRLFPALVERGYDVHALIFYHKEAPSVKYLSSKGVNCHSVRKPTYTEAQIRWILKIVKYISPDIFVPNIFVSGWFAARWIQDAGIPSIACHRNDDTYHWSMVEEFVSTNSPWEIAGLSCVSQSIRSKIADKKRHNRTMLRVIPSGVPIPDSVSDQTGALSVVYIGRLVQKQKRVRETLEAIISAIELEPSITATFIGNGFERLYLQNRVNDSSVRDKISIVGPLPPDQLAGELVKHNVLVLLSDYEGTPGAVMDAMASGLIPICTNIPGGIQELIQHGKTGLLVENRDTDFLEAMRLLLSSSQLRIQISTAARQTILENYSLIKTVDKWESFFNALIDVAKPRGLVQIPHKFELPPVNSGLKHQDRRMPSPHMRILKFLIRSIHKINQKYLSILMR